MAASKEKLLLRFIESAKKVHGDKYDYSKVLPVGGKTPVEIVCRLHGSFFQRKDVHLKGGGCKLCLYDSMRGPSISTEDYIRKVRARYPDSSLDYSLVEYRGSQSIIKIICPIHGQFEQTASHHYQSGKCPGCGVDKFRMTQDDFLLKSRESHGDFYDYSLVSLTKGFHEGVEIICPVHGAFKQKAGDHANGRGCKACGIQRGLRSRCSDFTTEKFVERSKEVHGDTYDYSLSEYVNTETKVKIICRKHGVFEQRPLCHTRGKGCIQCRNDATCYNFIQKYRENIEEGDEVGKIYVIRIFNDTEDFIKLGITKNEYGRFKAYRRYFKKAGYQYEMLFSAEMPNYQTAMLENEILKGIRKAGGIYEPEEYFPGRSECTTKDFLDVIVQSIQAHTEDKYFTR